MSLINERFSCSGSVSSCCNIPNVNMLVVFILNRIHLCCIAVSLYGSGTSDNILFSLVIRKLIAEIPVFRRNSDISGI